MSVTFGYWGSRSKGQAIRFFLEYLGVNHIDKRYIDSKEWFNKDSISEPFCQDPLVNLPYLIDGDKMIFESKAILVYLAWRQNRSELLGSTPIEQVLIEQAYGVHYDIMNIFTQHCLLVPKDKDIHSAYKQHVLELIYKFDKFLQDKTYCAGNSITVVDFPVFEMLEMLQAFEPDTFKQFNNLVKYHANFAQIPEIQAYMNSNRFQPLPFITHGYCAWSGM